MREEIVIQKKEFECFDVYFAAEGHSFVYANFKDTGPMSRFSTS